MCQKESWGGNLCDNGSPFHTEGPTTENARAWVVDVRAKGTKSNPCSDNLLLELAKFIIMVGRFVNRLSVCCLVAVPESPYCKSRSSMSVYNVFVVSLAFILSFSLKLIEQ